MSPPFTEGAGGSDTCNLPEAAPGYLGTRGRRQGARGGVGGRSAQGWKWTQLWERQQVEPSHPPLAGRAATGLRSWHHQDHRGLENTGPGTPHTPTPVGCCFYQRPRLWWTQMSNEHPELRQPKGEQGHAWDVFSPCCLFARGWYHRHSAPPHLPGPTLKGPPRPSATARLFPKHRRPTPHRVAHPPGPEETGWVPGCLDSSATQPSSLPALTRLPGPVLSTPAQGHSGNK